MCVKRKDKEKRCAYEKMKAYAQGMYMGEVGISWYSTVS